MHLNIQKQKLCSDVDQEMIKLDIWLANKLFSGIFRHFSGATYSIKGNFDNPELKLEKLFNTNVRSHSRKQLEIDWEPK